MKQYQPPTAAALYARVSSERQDVDLSVAGQLRALRDYAKNKGLRVNFTRTPVWPPKTPQKA